MNCPNCKSDSLQVTNCRPWQGQNNLTGIRRRRKCLKCNTRFSTIELIMDVTRGHYATEENSQKVEQITQTMAAVNGGKPATKPQKALTPAQRASKKKLQFVALQRARAAAIKIEDEDLLDDPELEDIDGSDIDDFEDFDL